jgi:hypothetical protein
MDITYFVYGFILLCLAVMGAYRLDVEGVNTASRTPWWKNSVGPFGEGLEGFVPVPKGSRREPEDSSPLLDFPPGKPAPADIFTPSPYHLLGDRLPPALDEQEKGALSCVNSRSCYATDAEAMLSRVGNYRQMTNQYKREYPDSCSALRQELVLGFYKATPLTASS